MTNLDGWWMVALAGGRIEHVRPEHATPTEAMAAALRTWGVEAVSAKRVTAATPHEQAIADAAQAVVDMDAQIASVRASDPRAAREYAAGRYTWPSLDKLLDARRDAWIEAALRSGADADKIGPRADVAHIARRIAIHG